MRTDCLKRDDHEAAGGQQQKHGGHTSNRRPLHNYASSLATAIPSLVPKERQHPLSRVTCCKSLDNWMVPRHECVLRWTSGHKSKRTYRLPKRVGLLHVFALVMLGPSMLQRPRAHASSITASCSDDHNHPSADSTFTLLWEMLAGLLVMENSRLRDCA